MNRFKLAFTSFLFIVFGCFSHAQDNQSYNDRLIEFYQNQQYLEAADYIKKAEKDTMYSFEVLSRLGYCYRMARDYKNAEQYYLQALEKDSLHLSTLSNLAAINYNRGNKLIARKYYQQILQIDSNHVNTLHTLAGLMKYEFDSLGNNLAIPLYERAYALQSNNIDLVLDYTQHLADLKDFKTTGRILTKAP